MPAIPPTQPPRKRIPPRQRHDLLVKWLSPQEEGDKEAGRFVGRPVREITKAFNRHFHVRVCERTVLRYMHEAVAAATRRAETDTWIAAQMKRTGVSVVAPAITLLPRGRPKSETPSTPRRRKKKQKAVCSPPKSISPPPTPAVVAVQVVPSVQMKTRPLQVAASEIAPAITPLARGRPKSETPPTAPAVAVQVALPAQVKPVPAPKPPRGKPGPKPRFKRWSRVWWELQALTGWSARTLYHHLEGFPAIHPLLGRRASFLQGLADLDAPRPTWDPVAATRALPVSPEDAFIEDLRSRGVLHVLHLHQVLLNTETGEWAVLLLAFDPQSQFINARVLDFDGPSGRASVARPRGRPRQKCHAEWLATVKEEGGATEVRVSPDAYRDFTIDTVAKTGIPYSPVWLSLGVAVPDHVVDALKQLAPDDAFVVSPVPDWPRGPLVVPMSLKKLCGQLTDLVNAHNREFAQPHLRKVRAHIEALKETGRVTPSTRAWLEDNGLYDVKMDHVTTLGLLHPPRQDVRRFALLSAFETGYPGLSSRGHYVAVQPLRIRFRFVGEGDS